MAGIESFKKNNPALAKAILTVLELSKWLLVLWLLLPLKNSIHDRVDFSRIVVGILLFVLFGGKIFYDTVLDNYKKKPDKKPAAEFVTMLASVTIIALLVGVTLVCFAYFLFGSLQNAVGSGN